MYVNKKKKIKIVDICFDLLFFYYILCNPSNIIYIYEIKVHELIQVVGRHFFSLIIKF